MTYANTSSENNWKPMDGKAKTQAQQDAPAGASHSNPGSPKTGNAKKGLRPMRTPRLWVWVVSCLTTFVCYPIAALISLAVTRNDIARIESMIRDNPSYGETFVPGWQQENLLGCARNVLGFGQITSALIVGLAILIGLEIFAYLHDPRSLDFYESLPEKRNHRFVRRLLAGAGTFVLPAAVNVVLALLICLVMGAMSAGMFVEALLAFVCMLILFAGIYGITVLASMLSGRILIAVLMTGFLLLAEMVIRLVLYIYGENFFLTWIDPGVDWFALWTNPLAPWLIGLNEAGIARALPGAATVGEVMGFAGYLAFPVLKMAVIAVCALLLSWLVYRKRPTEFAGGALRYPALQTAVKWITVVSAGLLFGMAVQFFIGGRHPRLMVVLALLACAVGCIIGEMIFARDGRAAFRKPWHIAVTGAITLLVIASMWFDWFGYDRYVPAANQVESVSFYPTYNAEDGNYYMNPEDPFTIVYSYRPEEYFEAKMRLADPDTIEAVGSLYSEMAAVMRQNEDQESDEYAWDATEWMRVSWHLKNGRTVKRKLMMVPDVAREDLNQILSDAAYKEAMYQKFGDGVLDAAEYINVYLMQTTVTNQAADTDAAWVRSFWEAYEEDLKSLDLEVLSGDPILTRVAIQAGILVEEGPEVQGMTHTYPVYESFTRTLAFLKENGFDPDAMPEADQVLGMEIYVPKEMTEEEAERYPQSAAQAEIMSTMASVNLDTEVITISSQKEMETLLPLIVPDQDYSIWAPIKLRNKEYEDPSAVLGVSVHITPQMVSRNGEVYEEECWWSGTIPAGTDLPDFLEERIDAVSDQTFLKN